MVGNIISKSNLESLQALKAVIRAEDDKNVSVDDALKRVLDFYKKFVPSQ